MKRITLTFCLGLLSVLAVAQPRPFQPERLNDEELIKMQTRDIVSWLDLDKRTETRFVKEYTAFRKEIDEVARDARPPQDIKSETEIDKAIQHNFAISEQIIQIRKKYYARFKEFLKPSQIQMMYRIENEAGRRMHDGPGGPGGPGGPEGHHMPDGGPMPPRHGAERCEPGL